MAFAGKRHAQELKKLEKTDVKISEARLFNPYGKFWLREVHEICIYLLHTAATTKNVLDDIDELLPRLSPHHPEIAELLQTARAEPVTPFTIHGHCDDSDTKTWPKTDPAMDRWFPDAVDQAPYIEDPPLWLDQSAANHVKPAGPSQANILILSSYPTQDPTSTAHLKFGVVDDVSNISISELLHKLDYVEPASIARQPVIQIIDIFPIRLDRKTMLNNLGIQTEYPLEFVPSVLTDYWYAKARELISMSTARVVLVSGRFPQALYDQYLKINNVNATEVKLVGIGRIAWLERDVHGKLSRIALYINHPECFKRYRAHVTTKAQHRQALRERLVDLTMIYFRRPVFLPAFLSTTQTWHQHSTGQLVPLRVFADFIDGDGDDTELRTALTWPRTPSGFECLRDWLQGRLFTVAEISRIALVYKVHTVAGEDSRRFFQSAEMLARYGPRAATFEKAMENMWDNKALIEEDDDDDEEEERPRRKRTRVTGVKAGLSKEGYDRQTYKMNQAKIAAGDKVAAEKFAKKRKSIQQTHKTTQAKVAAMDGKIPFNDALDKSKMSTTKKAPSKSLESGRRSRALRDQKIAAGDPQAIESKRKQREQQAKWRQSQRDKVKAFDLKQAENEKNAEDEKGQENN